MAVELSSEWLERFLSELNTDELKVYLHLGRRARPRSWVDLPDAPRFSGTTTDTSDPAGDAKRFKAALGGLRLKDLVELDTKGRFRQPYLDSGGTHQESRQYPSIRQRTKTFRQLEKDLAEAVATSSEETGYVESLRLFTRYLPKLKDGIGFSDEEAEKTAALFRTRRDRARKESQAVVSKLIEEADGGDLIETAEKVIAEGNLQSGLVWEMAARQLASSVGGPMLSRAELEKEWESLVERLFASYAGRNSEKGFLRLLQLVYLFAARGMPDDDPEEVLSGLRDATVKQFHRLADDYLDRARREIASHEQEIDDDELLAGRSWNEAKRLSAKLDLPIEEVMEFLVRRVAELEERDGGKDDFRVEEFVAPDISGLTKEEGEQAWIEAVASSPVQLRAFTAVLGRLRAAKRGYLKRAIRSYCGSILDLLEDNGMLDDPTDEILDNIVATINEQTAYFRDQYFALSVDAVEPDDVRAVLKKLAEDHSDSVG